jgi:hypothetical protein
MAEYKKIARKWRIIKLGREKKDTLLHDFVERVVAEIPRSTEILEKVAFEHGWREGERISDELKIDSPQDLLETFFMLYGMTTEVSFRSKAENKEILVIESNSCTLISKFSIKRVCLSFLEGMIASIGYRAMLKSNCPFSNPDTEESCTILVEIER